MGNAKHASAHAGHDPPQSVPVSSPFWVASEHVVPRTWPERGLRRSSGLDTLKFPQSGARTDWHIGAMLCPSRSAVVPLLPLPVAQRVSIPSFLHNITNPSSLQTARREAGGRAARTGSSPSRSQPLWRTQYTTLFDTTPDRDTEYPPRFRTSREGPKSKDSPPRPLSLPNP